jgi:hypothetical protein
LDTRIRFEYRDNDLRSVNQKSPKTGLRWNSPSGPRVFDQTDNVFLQRTRLYLGVKEVVDPFRFAVEIADSRRYAGTQYRPVPNGDEINSLEPIRLYGELHFDDLLPGDPHGNGRRKFFSVKVAGDFPEGGRVCGFRFFGLGEGEVGFASFPGFGDFGEDARDESQE